MEYVYISATLRNYRHPTSSCLQAKNLQRQVTTNGPFTDPLRLSSKPTTNRQDCLCLSRSTKPPFHSLKEHRCPLCRFKMLFFSWLAMTSTYCLFHKTKPYMEAPSFCCYFPLPSSLAFYFTYFIFHALIILFSIFHCISPFTLPHN